jgi:hypothetical protein
MPAKILIDRRYYRAPCITEGKTKITEHAWSRVLLEKLIPAHILKKCSAFYGTEGSRISNCTQAVTYQL